MGVVCGGTTYKKGTPLMVLPSIYTIYILIIFCKDLR